MGSRTALALLGALAALGVGCAGERASEPPPAEAEPTASGDAPGSAAARAMLANAAAGRAGARPGRTPPGFRRRSSSEDGFSIALPRRWHALGHRDARSPGVSQMLGRTRVTLKSYLAGLAMPDSPLKLLAFAPGETEFSTTMTVLVVPMRRVAAYPRWSTDVLRQVRRLASLRGPVRVRHVKLAAGRALRLDYERRYRRGGGHDVATMQVVVASGERLFTLTLATRPEARRAYERVFAAAADSLTVDY